MRSAAVWVDETRRLAQWKLSTRWGLFCDNYTVSASRHVSATSFGHHQIVLIQSLSTLSAISPTQHDAKIQYYYYSFFWRYFPTMWRHVVS
jgi:hypothetical protein